MVKKKSFSQTDGLPVDLDLQLPHHFLSSSLLSLPAPLLRRCLQRVQDRVERRIEREHEDGGPHVDLARDGGPTSRQQTQNTDREPAAEVRENDDEETTGDDQLLLSALGLHRDSSSADGPEDEDLAESDDEKECEVEDDEDGEGVAPAGEEATGDGQRETDPRLAVELPVSCRGKEREGGQCHAHPPGHAARSHC